MSLLLPPSLMVSVSGFRGRVGDSLTPELVAGVAAAFGAFLLGEAPGRRVLVGRDSRTSGPMFERAAVAGLLSVGCEVVELGIVATPTLMLAVREDEGAIGGIGITASHNPAEWNALKLAGPDGMFLDGERSAAFQRFLREAAPRRASWERLQPVLRDEEASGRHRARILSLPFLDVEAIRGRAFRVALDCVRGAGGRMVPALLEDLGCSVHGLHLQTDGRFPRDPEPTAASLAEFGREVVRSGSEFGLAVDPDVDRLSLVDGNGIPLGEDLTLALAADAVLRRFPGRPVVTNLSTSQILDDVAARHGSTVLRAPVGEIHVARRMQVEEAVIGGEGNGGVILPALHLTRDAPAGIALILQHLVDTGGSLAEAAGRWPRYRIRKEKVDFPRERLPMAYEAMESWASGQGGEVDRSDGVRIAWRAARSWVHLRPSGTEPVVRVIAEAAEEGALEELVGHTRALLEAVTPS